MIWQHRFSTSCVSLCCALAAVSLGWISGCKDLQQEPIKPVIARYPALPEKPNVPEFMHGTVWERVDLENVDDFPISGFGLVVNLDHTGNNDQLPTIVKQYMINEMAKEGFGSPLLPDYRNASPEAVLADDRTAVVAVEGLLPPGIRKGQQYDVRVSVPPRSLTTSLAGGILYRTDLAIDGTDYHNPVSKVQVRGQAKGSIFVNPVYGLNPDTPVLTGPARAALRSGLILGGGVAAYDRPIILRLLQPQASISRAIEQRVITRFKGEEHVAAAHDEGKVELFVPESYNMNWQHFTAVVMHTYFNNSPAFEAAMAEKLAAEAQKPDARLGDISYCWEAIGPASLPFISRLITDPNPDIAFAAARAGAFIGDPSGACEETLLDMAQRANHPYRLEAVEVLGQLPSSASVNRMLRSLVDSDLMTIRLAAYKILAKNQDSSIFSKVVPEGSENGKFILDVIVSNSPPVIYASRSQVPRIAILGRSSKILRPLVFSALNGRLTISSRSTAGALTIFYRDLQRSDPIKMYSNPDVSELIRRLGGEAAPEETPLNFTYGQIVAILMALGDSHQIIDDNNGVVAATPFVLQEPPRLEKVLAHATVEGRRVKDDNDVADPLDGTTSHDQNSLEKSDTGK